MNEEEFKRACEEFVAEAATKDGPLSQGQLERSIRLAQVLGFHSALRTLPEELVAGFRAKYYETAHAFLAELLNNPENIQQRIENPWK